MPKSHHSSSMAGSEHDDEEIGDVVYMDDDIMQQLDEQQLVEEPQDDDNESFQTFDEGSDAGDFDDGAVLDQQILESDALAHFDDHEDSAYCIAVLERPEGTLFVSGDGRDKCYAWTISEAILEDEEMKEGDNTPKADAKRVHELKGHTETVEYCKFDASGKWLVTGGMNNVLRVWDVQNGFALKSTLDTVPNEDLNFVEWH